ncbi:MAG: alpha/beta hydrolase family protein, partial [Solirubrobacteraceae bacterium]
MAELMTRAFYLDAGAEPIFAMLDEPPTSGAPTGGAAVLLCPPIGWQDVSSYRPRRDWARELANAGHPTLRIDLPGSGDSGGDPRDPDRVHAWVSAISAAVVWLRGACGRPRLAAVGIGLGGVALYGAVADGAPVDDLVLWGASGRGRSLVREQRAFTRLEQSQRPVREPSLAPEGALMTAGFLLSADTISDLERFDVERLPPPAQVRRALLLERDGIAVDTALRTTLTGAGTVVETAPGDGFADMLMAEPQDAKLARGVLAMVAGWLAAGDDEPASVEPTAERPEGGFAAGRPDVVDAVTAHDKIVLEGTGGCGIVETPIHFAAPSGRLFGILAEPLGASRDICLVLLNAGAQRRIGVNRMWVELSRRWAGRGVSSLRLDLEAIGDADGESGRFTDVNSFYVPEFVERVREVLDTLQERGLAPRFVLIGLCSGAYWALHTALADDRVTAALMLNTRVLMWDPELLSRREVERLRGGVVRIDSWRRIIRGQTPRSHLWLATAAVLRRLLSTPGRLLAAGKQWLRGPAPTTDEVELLLDRLRDRGQRGLLLFTAEEPVYEELERGGYLRRWDRWPNLVLKADERLRSGSGADHTLRPLWLQQH